MSDAIEVHELATDQEDQQQQATTTADIHETEATATTDMPSIPQQVDVIIAEEPTTATPATKAKQRGGRKKASDVPDLKEKVACPDCNKSISLHSLKFTHKKYCKAKQIAVEAVEVEAEQPIQHPYANVLEVTPAGHPEVHYVKYDLRSSEAQGFSLDPAQVTLEHLKQLKAQKKQAKQTKYKQLLAGKI